MITPEVIDSVKEALAPVAEALKQGAEFLYGVYYRQTIIEGIISIAIPVLIIIAIWIITKILMKIVKPEMFNPSVYAWEYGTGYEFKDPREARDHKKKKHYELFKVYCVIAAFALTLCIAPATIEGFKKVTNPHYYTIDRIINSVKNGEIK